MSKSIRITMYFVIAALFVFAGSVIWTRTRPPEMVAEEDSGTLWIALLKGFEGDVVYIGDKDGNSYFRTGHIFWSYFKLRDCRMVLPKRFTLGGESAYVVKLENMPGGNGSSCN